MRKKIVLVLVLTTVAACAALAQSSPGGSKSGGKYKTEVVRKGDIVAFVATTGTLNPVSQVDVGSEVSGEITKVLAISILRLKKGRSSPSWIGPPMRIR